MKTAEEILKRYETYVKHSYVPIFLEKNVLTAMEEYASQFKASQGSSEEQKPDFEQMAVDATSGCKVGNHEHDCGCGGFEQGCETIWHKYVSPLQSRIQELKQEVEDTWKKVQSSNESIETLSSQVESLEAENEELRKKGQKWDDLHRKIGRFYEEEVDGDLVDIGEVAAHAFGFL